MITLLLDHLWQSTWFVLAIALLAWSLRKNGAHVRYWLWLTASVKFLVPFSLLTFAGNQIGSVDVQPPRFERLNRLVEVTMAPASAQSDPDVQAQASSAGQATPSVRPATVQPQPSIGTPRSRHALLARVVGIVWLAGACAVFLLWLSRWLQMRRVVRNAGAFHSLNALGMPIPMLETASSVEPGIAGIVKPVLLLPKGIAGRLSTSQFQAVLAHELAHWRRRDNLTASIQMVVEAIFWFHPLVWWIGAQLIREREQACDESVLQQTGAPHDYAEGILNICQHYVAPPLRSAAISGGDLRRRIQRISTYLAPEALGAAKKIILTCLAVMVIAAPVLLGTARAAAESGALSAPALAVDHSSLEALYETAKQEGEVVVMAMDPRDAGWMSAAFAKSFPGIEIRVTPVLGHLPLVIADAESPRPGLDVVMTSLMEGNALDEGGFLANIDWTPFNLPANHIGLKGRFAYTNNFVFTVAYDKRRVGKQDVPVTWRELLGPQYRGTMSTNPFVMPRILAGLGLSWGATEAERYARQIRDQDMLNQFGDVLPYFLDEAKPRRYFIGMVSTVTEQWEKQRLPSGYVVPEPVIMEQQGTAVLATAPHPAAARLLAGWLATDEAKAIRHREAQSSDLLPDSSDPIAVALRARQVPIVYDTPETAGERARMAESFQPIFNIDPNYNPYRRRATLLVGVLSAIGSLLGAGPNQVSPAEQERSAKITQGDLGAATSEVERFYALNRAAKNALRDGNVARAATLAQELASLAPKYTNDWNYGNAIQDANQVLGRIALSNGNLAEAKSRLLASADSKGSPQMNSFGPNMQLAKALLEKGEKDVVLEYFNRCSTFWTMGKTQLARWTDSVKTGKIPDFGTNLQY